MILKMLHVILLASIKYLLTIPYARLIGLSYVEALIAVLVGGIGGFLFFYYLTGWARRETRKLWPFICKLFPPFYKAKYRSFCEKREIRKSGKVFSRKSRFIVSLRKNYGLWGIVLTTPILLTIPFGAFLANKYYSGRRNVVTYMLLSIVGWAFILTTLVQVFPGVIK